MRLIKKLILKSAKISPRLNRFLAQAWNMNTKSYWDQQYAQTGAQDNWGAQVRLYFYDLVAEALPREPATILDVGSGLAHGISHLSEIFDGWTCEGLDFSEDACRKAAKKTYCVNLLTEEIPSQHDYVLAVETLEHFSSPFDILNKLYKAAKKAVILTVPYKGHVSALHPARFDESSFSAYPNAKIEIRGRTLDTGEVKKDMLVVIPKASSAGE